MASCITIVQTNDTWEYSERLKSFVLVGCVATLAKYTEMENQEKHLRRED